MLQSKEVTSGLFAGGRQEENVKGPSAVWARATNIKARQRTEVSGRPSSCTEQKDFEALQYSDCPQTALQELVLQQEGTPDTTARVLQGLSFPLKCILFGGDSFSPQSDP